MDREIKIGDWIIPNDPVVNGINYGYNKRLVIRVSRNKESFDTVCEEGGEIETGLWTIYNTDFVARIELGD